MYYNSEHSDIRKKELSDFLDKIVYPRIGAKTVRAEEVASKANGVDMYFTFRDLNKVPALELEVDTVDNNFSIALRSLSEGNPSEDWLTKDTSEADYCIFVDVLSETSSYSVKRHIYQVRLYVVSKDDILDFLLKDGFSKDTFRKKLIEISKAKENGPFEKAKYNGFHLYKDHSNLYLVINPSILRSLRKFTFTGPNNWYYEKQVEKRRESDMDTDLELSEFIEPEQDIGFSTLSAYDIDFNNRLDEEMSDHDTLIEEGRINREEGWPGT